MNTGTRRDTAGHGEHRDPRVHKNGRQVMPSQQASGQTPNVSALDSCQTRQTQTPIQGVSEVNKSQSQPCLVRQVRDVTASLSQPGSD